MGVTRGAGAPVEAGPGMEGGVRSGLTLGAPSCCLRESCTRDSALSWVSLIQRLSRPFLPRSHAAFHSGERERGKGL